MGWGTSLCRAAGQRSALVGCSLLVALSTPARADFGTAIFVVGAASVVESSGKAHTLVKGTRVHSGDRIATAPGARVQLRFADGTFISLHPESELGIDAYRFGGEAAGRETAFFTLYRGSARFATGRIGPAPGSRFRTSTPSARLDVEHGEFVAIAGHGLQVMVGGGIVSLRNDGGALNVQAGQRAFVPSRTISPYLVGTAIPYRIAP
jgi:hypothetical protein